MEIALPRQAAQALERLERAGFEAYIVGGCVRDALMGRTPGDYDITTSARPEEVLACFGGERTIPTGIRHGTVTVVLEGMPLEITTYRADGEYTDHRRPDSVAFSRELRDDLCRRDFTINAMAYSPSCGLVDMYAGRADIARRVVRCVGDPARRFGEDALRMLRAVRFAATLDFAIDADTLRALDARTGDIAYVARERVFAELNKAVCAAAPQRAFRAGERLVTAALGLDSIAEYAEALERMALAPAEPALRWAALLGGLGSGGVRQALAGLRAPTAVIERAAAAVENAGRDFAPQRAQVLRLLSALGREGLADALALRRARALCLGDEAAARSADSVQSLADRLVAEGACCTLGQLAVSGNDMRALGFAGREIGAALGALLALVMDGELPNERAALLERARALREG